MAEHAPATQIPRRARERIIPCLLVGICAYYYLALLSYHPYDNSFFTALVPPQPLRNRAGVVGAALASYGVYYFGVLAYLLPAPFARTVLLMQQRKPLLLLYSLLVSAASLCVLAILLQNFRPYILWADLAFSAEGYTGALLVSSAEQFFGRLGAIILCLTLIAAYLVPNRRLTTHFLTFWEYLKHQGSTRLRRGILAARTIPALLREKFRRRAKKNTLPAEVEFSAAPLASLSDEPTIPRPTEAASPVPTNHSDACAEIFPATNSLSSCWGAEEELRRQQVEDFFKQFKITGKIIDHQRGPFVTTYAFKPEPGTKQNAIYKLAGDLSLHLQVEGIFAHPIHSKSAIGLQIPNKTLGLVAFSDLIQHQAFHQLHDPLPLALGVDVYGTPVYESLAQMPHLLLAGSTGSGKSVGLHSFICSLLSKTTPQELNLIFIDPKRLELTFYEGLPYLLRPIITEVDQALAALNWASQEMEKRYQILQHAKVRSIEAFNRWWQELSTGDRRRFCAQQDYEDLGAMPYIVIVIDELADLVLQSSGEISRAITQLAQKARACGIHMILATQRPSVDVITGLIKANMPARISYRLTSTYDSRTILDQLGAERLLGRGDMLWHKPGASHLQRLHGAFITDQEIKQLVSLLIKRYGKT